VTVAAVPEEFVRENVACVLRPDTAALTL
jgi:hypothetical protein